MVAHSTPKEDARAAFGDRARSVAVHIRNEWAATAQQRSETSGREPGHSNLVKQQQHPASEAYNEESRVHSTLTNRSLVFAGLHGCGIAGTILSITRVLSHHSSTGAPIAPSSFQLDRIRHVLLPIVAATAIPASITLGYLMYSSVACERFFEDRERARELWEMQNFPEGEYSEMVNIYQSRGLSQKDAETVVSVFAKDEDVFLDLMMVEELGYSRFGMPSQKETFWRACIPAMLSHSICITLPLIPQLWVLTRALHSTEATPVVWGRATQLSDALVVLQTLALSVLQTLLLHGAYANVKDAVPVVLGNAAWIASVYTGVYIAAKGLLKASVTSSSSAS